MSNQPPIDEGAIPRDTYEDAPTQVRMENGQPAALSLAKMRLVVVDGPDRGKEVVVAKESIRGGTFKGADLPLSDKTVSRNHFEIRAQEDGWVLADLKSTNGTLVGGFRIKEIFLKSGAIIQVGRTAIRFQPLTDRVEIPLSKNKKFGKLMGSSVKMREVFATLEKVAPTDLTLLIQGETGCGKEVVAQSVHMMSNRKKKPIVVVDCGSIPRNLIESELFGHERGAFTGATDTRQGAFEIANGGTVFLDEIGELPLELQPKLLRVLENREVRRIGSTRTTPLDVRILAATNRDVLEMVGNNTFREDLYFRLAVAQVRIPPLRERKDDVTELVRHFIEIMQREQGAPENLTVTDAALEALSAYNWPGNVRELRNVIERAVFLGDSPVIDAADVHLDPRAATVTAGAPLHTDLDLPFKDAKNKVIELFERAYLNHLLGKNRGNISQSAREAEIERKYLKDLLRKHNLRSLATSESLTGANQT